MVESICMDPRNDVLENEFLSSGDFVAAHVGGNFEVRTPHRKGSGLFS